MLTFSLCAIHSRFTPPLCAMSGEDSSDEQSIQSELVVKIDSRPREDESLRDASLSVSDDKSLASRDGAVLATAASHSPRAITTGPTNHAGSEFPSPRTDNADSQRSNQKVQEYLGSIASPSSVKSERSSVSSQHSVSRSQQQPIRIEVPPSPSSIHRQGIYSKIIRRKCIRFVPLVLLVVLVCVASMLGGECCSCTDKLSQTRDLVNSLIKDRFLPYSFDIEETEDATRDRNFGEAPRDP